MRVTLRPEQVDNFKLLTDVFFVPSSASTSSQLEDRKPLQNLPDIRAKDIASIFGLANFFATVMKQGRTHMMSGWQILSAANCYSHWLKGNRRFNPIINKHITDRLVGDIAWWRQNALRLSRKIHYFPSIGKSCIWEPRLVNNWGILSQDFLRQNADTFVVITSDASSRGYGWKQGESQGAGHWSSNEDNLHINVKELKAARIALFKTIASQNLAGKIVLFLLDNTTAISCIASGITGNGQLAHETSKIFDMADKADCDFSAIHIKGEDNVNTDLLSRTELLLVEASKDMFPEKHINKAWFKKIQDAAPSALPVVDMMASDSGWNALTHVFFSPSRSAFNRQLTSKIPINMLKAEPDSSPDFPTKRTAEGEFADALDLLSFWFPPDDMAVAVLKYIRVRSAERKTQGKQTSALVLIRSRNSKALENALKRAETLLTIPRGARPFLEQQGSSLSRMPPTHSDYILFKLSEHLDDDKVRLS